MPNLEAIYYALNATRLSKNIMYFIMYFIMILSNIVKFKDYLHVSLFAILSAVVGVAVIDV